MDQTGHPVYRPHALSSPFCIPKHIFEDLDYLKYQIFSDPAHVEVLIALLSDQPFDTFEETPESLNAYMPAQSEAPDDTLDALASQWHFTWTKTLIPGQNWNEDWEKNFQPVRVGTFCGIRALFHQPLEDVVHELVIQPRMAFGTGHHETTWMCVAAMEGLFLKGARVLDYGCGTGILAILAARLGAARVEAVDIESESHDNTLDNAACNAVSDQLTVRCGTIDTVQGGPFDLILANINRNVIIDTLDQMVRLLVPEGQILASGFLEEDWPVMEKAFADRGFQCQSRQLRGRWLAVVWRKHVPN